MDKQTFMEAWQKAHPQTSAKFEDDVFWRALYPHALVFAKVARRVYPGYFSRDYELIRRVASLTTPDEVRFEVDNHRYQRPEFGLLRRGLRLRLSGKRLIHLAKRTMRREELTDCSLTEQP